MFVRSFIESFYTHNDPLANSLKKFEPSQLTADDAILEEQISSFMDEVSKCSHEQDPSSYIQKIAQCIPLTRLQSTYKENALTQAQDRFKAAKYYLKTTDRSTPITVQTALNSCLDSLISGIDSVINAFGIHNFFKTSRNDFENNFKSQIITNLISVATLLSATLLPVLGATLAASIVGGLMLLIAALSLVYQQIKPMPSTIMDADNWMRKAQAKTLPRGLTNKVTVDNLALALATSKRVIITGSSRVGKTQSIKDLTYALAEHSKQITKCLPHIKQVFSWNSASLVTPKISDGTSSLQKIKDALGRHGCNTLKVFDEFGKTCTDERNNHLVVQLLTELEEKFDNVIAIATEDEYKNLCRMHPSLKNRFSQFKIESLESNDTEKVLHHTLLQEAPQTIVDEGIMLYLVTEYQNRFRERYPDTPLPPQPHTSKEMLRRCIACVSKSQKLPETENLERLRGQLDALWPKAAVENKVANEIIRNKSLELSESKKKHVIEKERFAKLVAAQDALLATKKSMNQTIIKIKKLAQTPTSDECQTQQSTFLLLHKAISKLELEIRREAIIQQVRLVIDKTLVDEIIEDELVQFHASLQNQ